MNSLAQVETRSAMFEDISAPSKPSVFHDRDTLLWHVKGYLDSALTNPNAPGQMEAYLRSQIEIRQVGYTEESLERAGFLFPSPSSLKGERDQDFFDAWEDLATVIRVAADRLWRDEFLNDSSDSAIRGRFRARRGDTADQRRVRGEVGGFELLCQESHVLMHLYLQAVLFRIRAMQNVHGGNLILHPTGRRQKIEGQLEDVISGYTKQLSAWQEEIRKVTGLDFFGLQYGDVQWFRALSKAFGPSSVDINETGWITLAADARTELRYQFFKARMRENWKTNHRLTAIIQWLFGITTGFGTRPRRFLATAAIFIGAYFFLFLANDWVQIDPGTGGHFCAASGSASLDGWQLIIKYLYLAVTNMSSLGSDTSVAKFCSSTAFSQALLTSSAIVGYFLLAMLAALLFQIITERD